MDINSQGGPNSSNTFNHLSNPISKDIIPANPPAGTWSCSQCGENNVGSSRYCRKCGLENSISLENSGNANSGNVSRKSSVWKWILVIFISLALIGSAVAGWYYWTLGKQKKEARVYISDESTAFGNTVTLINDLSTEKELSYKADESKDVFLKELEGEKNKSDKALAEIKNTREKNNETTVNKMVLGTDALLKQYYQEAEEKVSAYDSYITYECEVLRLEISMDKEMEKIDAIFKNSENDPKVVAKSIRETQKVMDSFSSQYKAITPPSGLEEVHSKEVDVIDKTASSFSIVADGVEKLNLAEIQKGRNLIDEAQSDKNLNEIYQLREYYFDEMHKNFSNIRGKADNVKTEFIKTGAGLETEIPNISIEGW